MMSDLKNSHRKIRPLRIGIVVTPQFTLNALANFVDVFRLASDEGDGSRAILCQWQLMSASDAPIHASCGFRVAPTSKLLDSTELDYIAVIGGLLYRGRSIDDGLATYLVRASKHGIGLLGICTGSFVLCRLGLMKGQKCCVSWYHYRDFVAEFNDVIPIADDLYVVDRHRITSSGGIGAALAAAVLVESHLGPSVAQKALHIMQIDKATEILQPAPPMMLRCDDKRVRRVLLMMEQNIHEPLTIDEIASRMRISRRSLERLFNQQMGMTPRTAYVGLRLKHARWMLRSRKPVAQIALETGFACGSDLSAAFSRAHGHSLSEERQRMKSPSFIASPLTGECDDRRVFDVR
jgi:transcriptional regulator GlxA family with amidase domain